MSLPNHSLITFADIQKVRAVSNNVTENRLAPYITEAQDIDFRGLIGKEFYEVLLTPVTPATFPVTYKYPELKNEYAPYLAYYAYARFLTQNQITSTDHSIVTKRNDWSDPISDATLSKAVNSARGAGVEYGNRFIEFMNDNVDTYPEWKDTDCFKRFTSGNYKGVATIKAVKGRASQWD